MTTAWIRTAWALAIGWVFLAAVSTPRAVVRAAERESPASTGAGKSERPTELTNNQIGMLRDQLVPAYSAGNAPVVVALVRDLLPKASPAVRAAMNDWLRELRMPSLEKMAVDSRLALVRQNAQKLLTAPTALEYPVLLTELKRQVDELLDEVHAAPICATPLPASTSFAEFREVLWSVHVARNKLQSVSLLSKQGEQLARAAPKARAQKAGDESIAVTVDDFAQLLDQAARTYREIDERALEVRIAMIGYALSVLENSKDLRERILAAHAVGVEGDEIQAFLKRVDTAAFMREALQVEGLTEKVNSQVERGRLLAGNLVDKSRLFYAGLHWWRRGRYGRGPQHLGLVKSEAALQNPVANVALIMPQAAPQPVDPLATAGPQCPDFDRRHHYWWTWENRKFERITAGIPTYAINSNTVVNNQKLGHFDGLISGQFW